MTERQQKERLLQALDLVHDAMTSPNTFENSKESTFSSLRRGCLDLRKDAELLDSDDFSVNKIRDAWLFLMELSKAKLRRKHALECINIMLISPKWGAVLRNDAQIQARLLTLSSDMQVALGHKPKSPDSPSIRPSTATKPIASISRKTSALISPNPTVISRSKSSTKQQLKRGMSKQDNSTSSSRRGSQEVPTAHETDSRISPPAESAEPETKSLIPPISEPGRRPETLSESNTSPDCNTLNPFRCDFNPFKEFRGKFQQRQPTSQNSMWWQTPSQPSPPTLPDPWW
jgi:hypothetical protein